MQVCLRVMMLSQLLIQGRMPETSTLCQLPHVDARVAKAMQTDKHQPVHRAWCTIVFQWVVLDERAVLMSTSPSEELSTCSDMIVTTNVLHCDVLMGWLSAGAISAAAHGAEASRDRQYAEPVLGESPTPESSGRYGW